MKKKVKISITSIAAVILVGFFSFTIYAGNEALKALKGVPSESCVDSPLYNPEKSIKSAETAKDMSAPDLLKREFEKQTYEFTRENAQIVSIKSRDNLNLNGFFVRNPSGSHDYVLAVHGYMSSTKHMAPYAFHFYEKGWNYLLPGQRGHGWSEGNYIDMGAKACQDVQLWVKYIVDNDPDAKILLYGVSMGAATVMNATGLELLPNVIACIEDCGYSSTWKQLSYRLKLEYNLPEFPILYYANLLSVAKNKYSFRSPSPVNSVKKSSIPTLFIHGTSDDYVPFFMLDDVYEAASCPKQKLEIEGATHARSYYFNPDLYMSTVDTFVAEYFGN